MDPSLHVRSVNKLTGMPHPKEMTAGSASSNGRNLGSKPMRDARAFQTLLRANLISKRIHSLAISHL